MASEGEYRSHERKGNIGGADTCTIQVKGRNEGIHSRSIEAIYEVRHDAESRFFCRLGEEGERQRMMGMSKLGKEIQVSKGLAPDGTGETVT